MQEKYSLVKSFLIKGNILLKVKRSEDYTKLKKSYILFICREMPFEGKDLHKFTFRNVCVEDPELELGDETCKIF